jgi:hypothetical protein
VVFIGFWLGLDSNNELFYLVSRKCISEDCGYFSLILCRPFDKFSASSIMENFRLHLFDISEEFVVINLVRAYNAILPKKWKLSVLNFSIILSSFYLNNSCRRRFHSGRQSNCFR